MERPASVVSDAPEGASLVAHYAVSRGTVDEMVAADGTLRPVWRPLVAALERIGPGDLRKRFARADQYLRDAGVYYRVYGGEGAMEREWPLAHIPLLLDEEEWQTIADGLVQRADILERIVADIYGPNRLVADGLLPAGLVAANPEFLRPVAGIRPTGGHFLHFCAFDLGRGPDGRWWVLGDRTQAPSGAGFALENRVATTRALPDLFGEMRVHRLAGFFRQFRDTLLSYAADTRGRAAILSPGPHNETYFEHAYIARYLGMMLLEGEDLTVADGRLMVRTVSGLKPVAVLWRRLDAAFADPLELRPDSEIGTPGLVEAVRHGGPVMVNALGSGIVETRALLAFLPTIAMALTGERLKLPGIATWWCGDAGGRAHVEANLASLMVGPAMSARLPFEEAGETVLAGSLDAEARQRLMSRIADDPAGFVGQEAVTLSTTPVFAHGHLEPRPASLRVYLARTPQGWSVMHGGFARIGLTPDPSAIAMQRGGLAADVWVVSDKSVAGETLLPRDDAPFTRAMPGSLPSRAAENLLWLGRYIERAEDTVRVLRAYHVRLAELADPDMRLLVETRAHLESVGIGSEKPVPEELLWCIDSAVASAGRIRDRFSPDGWLALRDLSKTLHRFEAAIGPGDDAARAMTVILRKLAGFSGLVHENMYRFTGWRFLEVGRHLERALRMTGLIARFAREGAPAGALDMLLEIGDSVMTHRRQYNVRSGRLTVIDLLALDPLNPRSVIGQLDRLKHEMGRLPGATPNGQLSPLDKQVLELDTRLAVLDPAEVTPEFLDAFGADLAGLYEALSRRYFA